jgi:hypothetical protein
MKKILFILTLSILTLYGYAQAPGIHSYVVIGDSLVMKDTTVTHVMPDTLANTEFVRNISAAGGRTPEFDYIDFDTTLSEPDYRQARIFYDTAAGGFTMMLNNPEPRIVINQEIVIYGRNATNTNLIDGEVCFIDSSGLDPYPVFRRAIADDPEIASATIGVVTETIPPGELGYITRFGGVTMDVSVFDENAILYLSPVDSGALVSYAPKMPFYRVRVGRVIEVGSSGSLGVDVEPFTGNDTEVAGDGILNGIILDKQAILDTQKVAGLYFETYNETNDTIDLPFMYQNEIYLLNTTSSTGRNGRAEVQLTYGSATTVQTNYIYIDNSGANPALAVSTTDFPTDGVRLAECGVQDSATHATYGFSYFQRFNNSINASTTDGLMNRSVKRQRLDGSKWESNVTPTVSIVTNLSAVDSLKMSVTSGIIWQFNKQTYDAQDGKRYLWLNSPTGLRWIGHLGEIDSTEAGVDLHGGTNRRYGLNVFAIQNSGGFEDFLGVTAPTNYYSTDETAISDAANYAVSSVPAAFGKVTVRLARIVVNYSTADNGTLTNLLGSGGYQDERGQLLGIGGGGGGGGGGAATTNFSDAQFTIYNNADATKIIEFDASEITTGNTRTMTMPDKNITPIDSADVENTTFRALAAEDSLIVGPHYITDETAGLEIEAEGGDEYLRLWDAAGTASIGATNTISLNAGVTAWQFDADYVTDVGNDTLATRAYARTQGGGGGGGSNYYDPGSRADADTNWAQVITNANPSFDGESDTVDYYPIITDENVITEYVWHINIPSDSISNGSEYRSDTLEAGQYYIVSDVMVIYDYETATYTSSDATYSMYLHTEETGLSDAQICTVMDDVLEASTDLTAVYGRGVTKYETTDYYTSPTIGGVGGAKWMELTVYSHTGSGTGTAEVYIYYKKVGE